METHWILEISTLHTSIDTETAQVAQKNPWLACGRGCTECCMDDITVFTIEALLIARHHGAKLLGEAPAPRGGCAFLSPAGDCRIYEHRPYVCRTQGLPLRWLEDPSLDGSPEYRDVCPLSEPPVPLEELAPEGFFTLGDFEGRLATLQLMYDPTMTRISLRDLFVQLSSPREPLGVSE